MEKRFGVITEEYCGVAGEPWTVQDASLTIAVFVRGGSIRQPAERGGASWRSDLAWCPPTAIAG